MGQLHYDLFPTPMGWFAAVVSHVGLRYASMKPTPEAAMESLDSHLSGVEHSPERLLEIKDAVLGLLSGERADLDDLTLDIDDAPKFHRAAWEACRSIPLGETRSYAWLAAQAGRPRAYRAAGQAMARNRVVLVVPCHRVIGSDGGLQGYGAGGLAVKDRLLKIEVGLRHRLQTPP